MSHHSLLRVSPHLRAVLQALFVTFLWSTSWVLIKIGLEDIPALVFAGLRYSLAAVCLLALLARRGELAALRTIPSRDRRNLIVLGLVFYSANQGLMFLALAHLPAMTTSLMLSFTPAMVALLGILLLAETLTRPQWGGIALYLLGALIYFTPVDIPAGQITGLAFAFSAMLANALATILGRNINRDRRLSPLVVTAYSMAVGAGVMLIAGFMLQGMPRLSLAGVAIIMWLAVVNTAFAFTLWNHTQQRLSAVESSVINNTMMIQIAVLAWVFLGEVLNWREMGGLLLAGAGMLVVQMWRQQRMADN